MNLTSLVGAALLAAIPLTAQDVIWGLGFAKSGGPAISGNSVPMVRLKDANGDGIIQDEEVHVFVNKSFHPTGGSSFISHLTWTIEFGVPTFYIADAANNQGRVVRGQDTNHNGLLDDAELANYWVPPSGTTVGDPEAIAVYFDKNLGKSILYVSLENGSSAQQGILRLVDTNGSGVIDPAEEQVFVDGSKGLTVPGKSGPVTLAGNDFYNLRVTPSGKLIAFMAGSFVDGVVDPVTGDVTYGINQATGNHVQPDSFCWFEFTDNGGTAVADVFLNMSTLNDIPIHPDFQPGGLPNTDLNPSFGTCTATSSLCGYNGFRYIDIDYGAGLGGTDVYYFGSHYRTTSSSQAGGGNPPSLVLNTSTIPTPLLTGVVFQAIDWNKNEKIDATEIILWGNLSGQTVGGVAPANTGLLLNGFDRGVWDMAAADGIVSFAHDETVVTFRDKNMSGIIDLGEVDLAYVPTASAVGYLPPYSPGFGPFIDSQHALPENLLPGPFPTGYLPYGTGCIGPTSGVVPTLDATGEPKVGTTVELAILGAGTVFDPAFLLHGDLQVLVNLGAIGLTGCFQLSNATVSLPPLTFPNAGGRASWQAVIPNTPALVGAKVFLQGAFVDSNAPPGRLPIYTTNALEITVQ